jgi:type IV secretory pathway VirB4 component
MYQSYKIENNILINKNDYNIDEIIENNFFHYIVEMASYNTLKKNNVYQMTAKEPKEVELYKLFEAKWNGVISIMFDFSNKTKKNLFDIKYSFGKTYDKEMRNIMKDIKEDTQEFSELLNKTATVNSIFIGDDESANIVSTYTGLVFTENNFNGDKLYKNTLFKMQDTTFTFFLEKAQLLALLNTTRKKMQTPQYDEFVNDWFFPDYWGKDYAGGFINHTFKKNTNPHTLIVGETGSGKTTTVGKMIKMGLCFDNDLKSKLLEENLVSIRYFDIDLSLGNFFKNAIHNYPEKSLHYTKGIKNIKFNLLDFEIDKSGQINDIDKIFATSFIDMILNIMNKNNNTGGLSANEKGILGEAIENIYAEKDKHILNLSLRELEQEGKGAYQELIDELLEQGFTMQTGLLELPEKYNYLKKPTFRSVIDYLSRERNNSMLSKIKRDSIEDILQKLEPIKQLGIFDFLPNKNFNEYKQIFYLDATEIKDIPELLVSIVWLFVNIFIKIDKADKIQRDNNGKKKRKIYYVLEESHNFLGIDVFADLFNKLSKEVRKYGIEFKFIIHRLSDINPDIYSSVATKLFLFKEGSKNTIHKQITEIDAFTPQREKVFSLIDSIPRGFFVIHSEGEDAMRFIVEKEEIKYFQQASF